MYHRYTDVLDRLVDYERSGKRFSRGSIRKINVLNKHMDQDGFVKRARGRARRGAFMTSDMVMWPNNGRRCLDVSWKIPISERRTSPFRIYIHIYIHTHAYIHNMYIIPVFVPRSRFVAGYVKSHRAIVKRLYTTPHPFAKYSFPHHAIKRYRMCGNVATVKYIKRNREARGRLTERASDKGGGVQGSPSTRKNWQRVPHSNLVWTLVSAFHGLPTYIAKQ